MSKQPNASPQAGTERSATAHATDARTSYKGPERRRHRVYVTRNTEYHFRDGFCVAVRDRRTGEFLQGHLALHRRVDGGLRFFEQGGIAPNPGDPRPGESIYFASHGPELVTSPLESVERPTKETAGGYPSAKRTPKGEPKNG